MATSYKNPANGYSEEVSGFTAFLGGLIFGPLYYAANGLWGAALIFFVASALAIGSGIGIIFYPLIAFVCGFTAPGMLHNSYLRKGWVKAETFTPQSYTPPAPEAQPPAASPVDKLSQLVQMKESGHLTDAEFQSMKTKLLEVA